MPKPQQPLNLIPTGSSPIFTRETLPNALLRHHALKPGLWGFLRVLEGTVIFVDVTSGEEREVQAPQSVTIAPEAPHKLRLREGSLTCRIDFFAEKRQEQQDKALSDLDHPEKIATFVRNFYSRVREDDLLGPVFVDQAQVDWEEHISKLTAFWCKIEFDLPGFQGAPTAKHSVLSREQPFRGEQFARWVSLLQDTVDRSWSGPHAESIKRRALRIAQMQSRVIENAEEWGTPPRKEAPWSEESAPG